MRTQAPVSNTQSFSDLNFDRLWSTNAERDKNTSIQIGVYRGNASIAIFSGTTGGAPKVKIPLPKQFNILFREIFKMVRKGGPDTKITVPIQKWDPGTSKMVNTASVSFGLDAANIAYIGVVATGQPAAKFPIRTDLKWDISTLSEINSNQLALDMFLAAMDNVVHAVNLTSFKMDPSSRPGGSGGNRPNYGSGNRAAAPVSIEDDIPF